MRDSLRGFFFAFFPAAAMAAKEVFTMLVPLDLAALAWRQNHLSPELALGWRLGRFAHDRFCDLSAVRIAAARVHPHTEAALARLARFPEAGAVLIPAGPRPWDLLFVHEPTGTALKAIFIRRMLSLPAQEDIEAGDLALHRYQGQVTGLVGEIVEGELNSFCVVTESRFRVLAGNPKRARACCPWCRRESPDLLLEVEERVCCPVCSGLEPAWLTDRQTFAN